MRSVSHDNLLQETWDIWCYFQWRQIRCSSNITYTQEPTIFRYQYTSFILHISLYMMILSTTRTRSSFLCTRGCDDVNIMQCTLLQKISGTTQMCLGQYFLGSRERMRSNDASYAYRARDQRAFHEHWANGWYMHGNDVGMRNRDSQAATGEYPPQMFCHGDWFWSHAIEKQQRHPLESSTHNKHTDPSEKYMSSREIYAHECFWCQRHTRTRNYVF